ncbi:MAG: type I methionyl aminopeptidase [Elusimicrobia bacterium]|nr:type I methionyl aminopeptidase [Elusimicrobiota bacterium]
MFSTKTVELKGAAELAAMRRAGSVLAQALAAVAAAVRPGLTTLELDRIAVAELARRKAEPAFLGYRGFPASLCVSVNDEIIHGIPSDGRRLSEGDLVSLDMGCRCEGFYSDAAVTVGAGALAPEARRLLEATRDALQAGIDAMRPGGRLGDVSNAIQRLVEGAGFSVVREFVGHGIGRALHEEPPVPNFGKAGTGPRLVAGMVLAVEPMVNAGSWEARTLSDGWTCVTKDGSLSAHFEHTVAMTERGPEVLTRQESRGIKEPL